MAKFYGNIGFASFEETKPGVIVESIKEKDYYGDILQNKRMLQGSSDANDDINVSNEISIIADAYANENFFQMRYVVYMGAKWKVTSVKVEFPRLILTLGGIYNGSKQN